MTDDGDAVQLLDTLVRMTETVLDGAVTPEQVRDLMGQRDGLMRRVIERPPTDEASRRQAQTLAERLLVLDEELVSALWRPRRDAFAWLADKVTDIEAEMPHLSALLTAQR